MKFNTAENIKANGTCLQGYVQSTFDEIVEIFGKPNYGPQDYSFEKVTCEWVVQFEDGTIATIYDWKMCETPYGKYYWHIGGFNHRAIELIEKTVEMYRAVKNVEKQS